MQGQKLPVFLSWSGERSEAIAIALRSWLPDVMPDAAPWLSKEDLRKGGQWWVELSQNLSTAGFGLSLVTPENQSAPWLLFEAGVISKALPEQHCCPVLCGMKATDLRGPMAQFQATTITSREDMWRLIGAMNSAGGVARWEESRVEKWFLRTWPDFEQEVSRVLAVQTAKGTVVKAGPTDRELLEEVVARVRQLGANRTDERTGYESETHFSEAVEGLRVATLNEYSSRLESAGVLQAEKARRLGLYSMGLARMGKAELVREKLLGELRRRVDLECMTRPADGHGGMSVVGSSVS